MTSHSATWGGLILFLMSKMGEEFTYKILQEKNPKQVLIRTRMKDKLSGKRKKLFFTRTLSIIMGGKCSSMFFLICCLHICVCDA